MNDDLTETLGFEFDLINCTNCEETMTRGQPWCSKCMYPNDESLDCPNNFVYNMRYGESMADISRRLGGSKDMVPSRIRSGMDIVKAFNTFKRGDSRQNMYEEEIPMWKQLDLSPNDFYCKMCIRKLWTPTGCRVTPWRKECAICRLN